jgi:hypothetical protein
VSVSVVFLRRTLGEDATFIQGLLRKIRLLDRPYTRVFGLFPIGIQMTAQRYPHIQ